MARLITSGKYQDYWRADDGTRPFFHPSDAGLPVVSLLEYSTIAAPEQQKQAQQGCRSLSFEMKTTPEVTNPSATQGSRVRRGGGRFRAHRVLLLMTPRPLPAAGRERSTRILSMPRRGWPPRSLKMTLPSRHSCRTTPGISFTDPSFDASMLMGRQGNAPYMFFRSYKYTSAPGAIVNGITAASRDEDGIAFNEASRRHRSRRRLALDWRNGSPRSLVFLRRSPTAPATGKNRSRHKPNSGINGRALAYL